jgi:hypothetical protein
MPLELLIALGTHRLMDLDKYLVLRKEISLLLIGVLWSVFSYFFTLYGEPDIWFTRSGAVLVLMAVIVEFRLGIIQQRNSSRSTVVAGLGIPNSSRSPSENKNVAAVAHVLAVTGTLIWAYGDWLHKCT